MAAIFRIPGVFVEEQSAFPFSIPEAPTAIPAFIGYTEKALKNGVSILNKPTKINSLAEYVSLFGADFDSRYNILNPELNDSRTIININGFKKVIDYVTGHKAFMFASIKLFYANGGNECNIVSVGTYGGEDAVSIELDAILGNKISDGNVIEGGLKALEKEQEPILIIIPDAVSLPSIQCYNIYQSVLKHCSKLGNRMAIFDIHNGFQKRIVGNANIDIITRFREQIGTQDLNFGAAYYPWVQSIYLKPDDLSIKNIDLPLTELKELLPENKGIILIEEFLRGRVDTIISNKNLHLNLLSISKTYKSIIDAICKLKNSIPTSGAMAGIYTIIDNSRGVWKAPANISINQVIKPTASISHTEQELLSIDPVSGKSINAIRTFPGKGVLVWGARTLDGNNNERRYINVQRTVMILEQSINLGLRNFVFEPNDANTWAGVKNIISNYLDNKWRAGALAGAKSSDAFFVSVGLNKTMTAQDILEGKMIVMIGVSIIRPAEFITFRLVQNMPKP